MKGKGDKMKKLVSLILCLAMILAWVPAGSPSAAAAESPFDGGSGTEEDPYLVSTVGDLKIMSGYPNSYFLQVSDIDGSSLSGEYAVSQLPQGSVYDGGGHAITGLNVPLFRSNHGTIQNLTLEEPWIYIDKLSYFIDHNTDISIGALACSNSGTIQNCHVSGGRLYLKTSDNYSRPPKEERVLHQTAGMLVGENSGTVKNCSGTYKKTKYYGSDSGVYTSCSAYANYFTIRIVQGTGGLVGWNRGGSMENCYCDYPVQTSSSGDNSMYFDLTKRRGVLCGNNEGTISGSYFDGNTSAASGEGSVEAQQMAVGQDLVDQLNRAGGESFWGLNGDGYLQMNARSLGVSSTLSSGSYDMWMQPVEFELALNENVPDGEIYYTILGEAEGRQPYTGPITRDHDTDLVAYGQLSDSVYQASYYSYLNLRHPVRADPGEGTYDKPIQVKLGAGQDGAEIYYTTDGSDPTTSSSRYPYNDNDVDPVKILGTTTLKAVAKVDGVYGDVMTYHYVISPAVTAQPGEGEYDQPIEVTLDVRDGYEIWYTMDGSDPTQGTGIKYEAPITICQTTDLKVVAAREGKWGEVKTFSYRYPQVTITAEPGEGEQTDAVHVALTCSADYAQLFYQLDDGEEQAYTGPIDIFETATLTVYARYDDQLLATETYTYTLPEIEIKATPEPGNYPSIQTITLSCNRSEAELYYSIGSSTVSWDGIRYTGPFELDHSATVWVEARMGGETVARKWFDYKVDVPKVTADPAPGDLKAPLEVELTTDPAYEIWYTTDGSDPKTSGKKYEGPISIDKPVATVIRAVPKSIDFEDTWGTTSDFRYTFNSQKVEVSTVRIVKWADYEANIRYYSTLPYDKTVDVCVAAYYNGEMLGTAVKQVTLTKNSSTTVEINYPYDPYTQLPSGAVFKVFCLDSETLEPCTEPYTCSAYSIPTYERLQEIIVEPTSIEGYVGDYIGFEIMIRKTNSKEPVKANGSWEISDRSVAVVTGDDWRHVNLKSPGTTTLTCSYSDASITKTVEVPITVKESVYQPEFLADPTAEPLPEDAIPISNAEELAALSDSADGANTRGKTFYLTNDIQLTGEWEPVRGFQGTLDGRGHKISGLYISSMYGEGEQLAGVFGSAYNAAFKNLAVEIDSRGIRALKRGDAAYAGGLVGNSKNTDYINCYTTGGRITAQGDATYAGGLVGWLMNGPENRVVNCFSDCEVNAESQKATVTNLCVAGGLIGQLESSNANQMTELSRCYFTGEVEAWYTAMGTSKQFNHCSGGLVGIASRVAISDSFSQGKVAVSKYYDTVTPMVVGGLVGNAMESTISRCYASGTTYARAAMSGTSTSGTYIGGLYGVPTVDSLATNSYRVAQEVNGNWHSNPTYNNAGTELTYDQAGDAGFYSGFDFTNTWTITEGAFRGKPHLQYQD